MKNIKSNWLLIVIGLVIIAGVLMALNSIMDLSLVWTYLKALNWYVLGSIFICGLLYRLFDELQDKSMNNKWTKFTWFLNINESSIRKWKPGSTTVPRFWGSSTFLVFITDGEHLFQWLKNRMIEVGLLIICWQVVVVWAVGSILMSFIKEKFLKELQ